MASSTSSSDIVTDLSPFIRVYKDGKVERLLGSPFVPACPEDPATGVSSKDVNISPHVSARLYLPKAESIESSEKLPILIYYHGGGFCLDSAFDFLCHRYLNLFVSQAKAIAVSVNYRLAPEFPLPAAYEDSWTAITWVASHSVSDVDIGGDKEPWLLNHGNFDKIYLVGDSSGGNIVHNLAIKAGGESLPGDVKIAGGIISHPFFWGSKFESNKKAETTSSDQQHHNHNHTERSYYYRLWLFAYASAPGGIDNPMVNPFPLLSAGEESDDAAPPPSLSGIGCPKLLVCTSEKDDIRETSVLYVDALKKSGWKGEVEFVDIEGEGHCFQIFKPDTENAKNFINRMASFINASSSNDIVSDISPYIRVYRDGTVERIFSSPFVPPSLNPESGGVSSKDIKISSEVSARLYLPFVDDDDEKLPILVYYHAGGFCLESAFSFLHHRYLNLLVSQGKCIAVSVEYRLAPENPLPAAFQDSWTALQWVTSHHHYPAAGVGGDPWLLKHGDFNKLYLGGDSAGGIIVHYLAIRAGVESLPGDVKITGGFLSHPFFWGSKSEQQLFNKKSGGSGIGEAGVGGTNSNPYKMWMLAYPSVPGGIDNPLINPIAEDAPSLTGLTCSRLLVVVAEKDELRETGLMYVDALKKSGWKGDVDLVDVDGEDHCFNLYNTDTEKSKNLIRRIASFIRN